jgi:uncharacterized protein YbcV (DUF1398 family)
MKNAIENLERAMQLAMSIRPKVGGFPYLAEVLRRAGVTHNIWTLPSCQSIYLTKLGPVVSTGTSLINATVDIPVFDREALVRALRKDQAGESSFPEFLKASWDAGVMSYVVDFEKREVIYQGVRGESYIESYPQVAVEVGE